MVSTQGTVEMARAKAVGEMVAARAGTEERNSLSYMFMPALDLGTQ